MPTSTFARRTHHLLSAVLLVAAAYGCSAEAPLAEVPTASAAASAIAPSAPFDAAGFVALQPAYIEALGARGADATRAAVDMEGRVLPFVESALAVRAGAPDGEAAGLALVYGSLLLTRDLQHVLAGEIDGPTLFAAHPYASATDVDTEIPARRVRAVALLKAAAALRPSDHRVASWLAGAEALVGTSKELPAGAKQKVLDAVDVEPTFNLWTAFIALRHEPLGTPTSEALFEKTRAFLDAKRCRDVAPGSVEEHNCRSGPLAPFNTQAAVVMLGDQYLRRGEAALGRGEIPVAMPLLGTARGIYATLSDPANAEATKRWRFVSALDARLARLGALKPGAPPPDAAFWTSNDFEAAYDCASCHAP